MPRPAHARISVLLGALGLAPVGADVIPPSPDGPPAPFQDGVPAPLDTTVSNPTLEIRRTTKASDPEASEPPSLPLGRGASISTSDEISVVPLRTLAVQNLGSGPARLGSDTSASESTLSLKVLLPTAAHVRNRIFDNAGVFVAALDCDISEQMLAAGRSAGDGRTPVTLQWNLRAMDGSPVPSGVYLWKLLVTPDRGAPLETVQRMGIRSR